MGSRYDHLDFNSSQVRLQDSDEGINELYPSIFQFLTGTITGCMTSTTKPLPPLFQFLTGTITGTLEEYLPEGRAISIPHRYDYRKFRFVSISPRWLDFNSSQVRLQESNLLIVAAGKRI